jgi:ATP-dependent Clp protease protease subunit
MNYIRPDVRTLCLGLAASMGAMLLTAGTKGKRSSLPNARIMIHQPHGGVRGQASDIEIHAREILDLRDRLNQILCDTTGQLMKVIEEATERDRFMSPLEAKKFGLIDDVIAIRPKNEGDKKKKSK